MNRKTFFKSVLLGVASFPLFRPRKSEATKKGIGARFYEGTRHTLLEVFSSVFRTFWKTTPLYKSYKDKPIIALPKPVAKGELDRLLRGRRSARKYKGEPLSREELSRLLFAAQGITARGGGTYFRTAPSAGALYPIEIYPVVHGVEGLEKGLYHYNVRKRSLEQITKGAYEARMTRALLDQEMGGDCATALVLTSIFGRVCRKYGERGYRYALMEAGHICQNVYLQSEAMGLGCVAIGAFYDDMLNGLIGIDGKEEAALYVIAVGRK